jgi:hypothetical protein
VWLGMVAQLRSNNTDCAVCGIVVPAIAFRCFSRDLRGQEASRYRQRSEK